MTAVLLMVCSVGIIAAGAALGRWPLPWPLTEAVDTPDRSGCQPPLVTPAAPEDTVVRVLNGTSRTGLATDVANELRNRGFEVDSVGNARSQEESATIRFQPELEAEALALAAHVTDPVLAPSSATTGVVLTLGGSYERLRPPERAAEVIEEQQPSPLGCASQ